MFKKLRNLETPEKASKCEEKVVMGDSSYPQLAS
jgi:hypothetical protein